MSEEKVKITCPLCGSNEYSEKDLSEEIKDAFLESMLGNVPFARTYDIMDGKLSLRICATTDYANALKAKMVVKIANVAETCPDIRAYIPLVETAMDVDSQVLSVTVAMGDNEPVITNRTPNRGIEEVLKLEWDKITPDTSSDFMVTVMDTFNANLFNGITVPGPILKGAVAKHNTVVSRLVQACIDANFLAGTGR
jgi:hypothetical protein